MKSYIYEEFIMHANLKNSRGFTLVELSIVIVIIGLIAAGVVSGSGLVETAKLKALGSDLQKYETAINAFKLQYNVLPGDMANADSYWPGVATNGDGDKSLYWNESYYAWHHLSLAGLLEGNYPGTVLWTSNPVIGIDAKYNTPGGFGPAKGQVFYHMPKNGGADNFGANSFHNNLIIARAEWPWGDGHYCFGSTLKSVWAYYIDNKFDDGQQYTGNMYSPSYDCGSGGGACNTANPLSATEVYGCAIAYKID